MRIVIGRASTAAALLAAALLALPVAVSAQSLGEAAERNKKEKERKPAKPVRVITDSDLRSAGSDVAVQAAPADEATPATGDAASTTSEPAPAKRGKSADELRAEAQAKWQARLQEAQGLVSRLSTEADRVQTSLNDLTQSLYGSNRASMISRLDEVKRLLSAAQQSVADLEEEGRRSRYTNTPARPPS